MNSIREWLERLYASSPGYFTLSVIPKGKTFVTGHHIWFDTNQDSLDKAAKNISATQNGDIYLSIPTYSAPTPGRGKSQNAISIPGYWADLDIGEFGHRPSTDGLPNPPTEQDAMKVIQDFDSPSMLLHSGGGLQGLWLFDKPWVFEPGDPAPELAVNTWADSLETSGKGLGFHVDRVADLARVLRAPGSFNHKEGLKRPVVVRWNNKPSFELIKPPVVETLNKNLPTVDSDKFPLSWDDILLPHGYTNCGDGLYARPDKKCSEGHSISVSSNPEIITNFSESDTVLPPGKGQGLSKEKVFKLLNPGKPVPAPLFNFPERMSLVKAKEESNNQEWIIENIIEKKQRVSVAAPGGAMKSLVLLNLAVTLGLGLETLGTKPKEPVTVMYLDYENGADDILDRIESMGFIAEQLDDPSCKLHIIHMPEYGWLDTKEGGQHLAAHAQAIGAELVIIDTLSKVTQGDENANETYAQVLTYTSNPLIKIGAAVLYLDHTGHSSNRARGASSKPQNVDIAFNVTRGAGAKENEQYWDKRPETNGKDRTGRGLKTFTLLAETTDGVLKIKLAGENQVASELDKHATALQFLHDLELMDKTYAEMWRVASKHDERPVGKSGLEKALKAWNDASGEQQEMHIFL